MTTEKKLMSTGKAELLSPYLHPVNLHSAGSKWTFLWDTFGAKLWGSGGCGGVTQISQWVDGKDKTLHTLPKGTGDLGIGKE